MRESGLTYDQVWRGWDNGLQPPATATEPMPATACRSVEPAPKSADYFYGPHHVHDLAVSHFVWASGFGFVRMQTFTNSRGVSVGSRSIERVELVSLLTDDDESVYVLEEAATPPLARRAKRRPLDQFEQLGLEAVRRGEHLVWTPEAPKRMLGAIRAESSCLECHSNAKVGDLLGAFTYYLDTPVDKLAERDRD
jgi:hypothetical protein